MAKYLKFILILALISFTACEKNSDQPGGYPQRGYISFVNKSGYVMNLTYESKYGGQPVTFSISADPGTTSVKEIKPLLRGGVSTTGTVQVFYFDTVAVMYRTIFNDGITFDSLFGYEFSVSSACKVSLTRH